MLAAVATIELFAVREAWLLVNMLKGCTMNRCCSTCSSRVTKARDSTEQHGTAQHIESDYVHQILHAIEALLCTSLLQPYPTSGVQGEEKHMLVLLGRP